MKKILAVIFCALAVFTLSCCTEGEVKEDPATVETPDVEVEDVKEKDSEIELDIKPLDEVDGEELSVAAANLGFKNPSFFHAFANALGKKPAQVTQKDVDDIHYIAIGPETDGEYTLYVGYIDYVDLCMSEAATEETVLKQLNELVMMSEFNYAEGNTLSDLGNFKNVEMFEIYDVVIDDVAFITNYDGLIFGYFRNNGITDVSALKDYNPESLIELDFTGNDVADWSPLEHIKEKVLVFYDLKSGFSSTLENYLEQKENPIIETPSADTNNTTGKDEPPVLVDENGNPADFSSLFE